MIIEIALGIVLGVILYLLPFLFGLLLIVILIFLKYNIREYSPMNPIVEAQKLARKWMETHRKK